MIKLQFSIFILVLLSLSVVFLSGCSLTNKPSNYICMCRDTVEGGELNSWTPYFDFTKENPLIFSTTNTKNDEYNCYKACSEKVNTLSIGGTSNVVDDVYGNDYKLVKFDDKQLQKLEDELNLAVFSYPHLDAFSDEQILASLLNGNNYVSLVSEFPQLAFLKNPSNCENKYCFTSVNPTAYHVAYNSESSLSKLALNNYHCDSASATSAGYLVRDSCCWHSECKNNPATCSFPKCPVIKKFKDIPECGCVCGSEFSEDKVLSPANPKCCDSNGNLINC
ncbi:MAG: hypothetical protein GWP09_02455 [Nitrospiraceae bacterium]|nr:hypothetical protein [Nitrospiraceae bacterium]